MNNWCICWFFMHPFKRRINPICHLLALLGGATIVVVSRLRFKCDDSAPRRISVLKSAPRRKKYGNHCSNTQNCTRLFVQTEVKLLNNSGLTTRDPSLNIISVWTNKRVQFCVLEQWFPYFLR